MYVKSLKALVHISEEGTISSAAQRLNVTQPALSSLIRRLEDELGTKIFVRHSRGVSFTEEGNFLLERAKRILSDISAATSEMKELGKDPVGEVRLGLPASVASGLVPELLPRLRSRFPNIHLQVSEQMSGNLMETLHFGGLDMAILFDIEPMPGLRSEPLLVEEIMLLVAADDPLGQRESVSMHDLAKRPLALPSSVHSIRRLVDRASMSEGVQLNVCADIDSLFGLIRLVLKGYPTFLPTMLVQDLLEDGLIRAIAIERPRLTWTLHLATRIDSIRPRAAMVVGSLIAEVCADMVRKGIWPGRLHSRRWSQ